jgi:hypothetical protein
VELQDAVSAYLLSRADIEAGTIAVRADHDPPDPAEAALLKVVSCVRDCQSLGISDGEIGQVLDPVTRVSRTPAS